jgi:hypothetical protein
LTVQLTWPYGQIDVGAGDIKKLPWLERLHDRPAHDDLARIFRLSLDLSLELYVELPLKT